MPLQYVLFATSFFVLVVLVVLFNREKKRGDRFLGGVRSHVDFWILKLKHTLFVQFRPWSQYVIRQIMQYLFHTFLRGIIRSLSSLEERLKFVLRTNKTLAKKTEAERTVRNKLDEIALHKLEVALSEKEKRIRRKNSLEG